MNHCAEPLNEQTDDWEPKNDSPESINILSEAMQWLPGAASYRLIWAIKETGWLYIPFEQKPCSGNGLLQVKYTDAFRDFLKLAFREYIHWTVKIVPTFSQYS